LSGIPDICWQGVHDRALAAGVGFALGDALGATVEFMTAREIAARYGVHKDIVGGGWLKLRAGQVTDDTQMCLALGQAILSQGRFDAKAAADALAAWLRGKPLDVGNTCRRGIQEYIRSGRLETPPNEGDAGNGAVMRNLPVALLHLTDDEAFAAATVAQCHITHNHPLSDAAALALGRMLRLLVRGEDEGAWRREAQALVERHPKLRFNPYPGRASGYIVDTMQTVLHFFFSTTSFEECVVGAVNRGEDADTCGALAGMLAGARYGLLSLPARWLKRLDPMVWERIRTQTYGLLGLAQREAARQP
jgi:ADP-ribosyl-[dinitrogen reductase] hydrolase